MKNISGFSIIEVLVTIVILSIGLLGLAGLQARGIAAQKEAFQRAQALTLLKDIAGRIQSDRVNGQVGAYVANRGTGYNGSAVKDCSTEVAGAPTELCEWHNNLLGAARGGSALSGVRGCVYNITPSVPNALYAYRVSVAWQGYNPTWAPAVACGAGSYASENLRRAVTLNVVIPVLN